MDRDGEHQIFEYRCNDAVMIWVLCVHTILFLMFESCNCSILLLYGSFKAIPKIGSSIWIIIPLLGSYAIASP